MTRIDTSPATFVMGPDETLPLGVDFSALLESGEEISAATVTLVDLTGYAAYTNGMSGSVQFSSSQVIQVITALQPGHNYQLDFDAEVSASKVWQARLGLLCPQR